MRPVVRLLAVVLLALAVSTAPARAQGHRWSDPYESGVDDVNHQRWTAAIDSLTKAIAADPKAQANKHIEGTYYENYFPYFYRGIAYLAIGDLTHAQADFRLAHDTRMPAPETAKLQKSEADLQAALTRLAPKPAPQTPPPAAAAPAAPPPEPAKPAAPDRTAQAANLVREGLDLLNQGQLDGAQARFQDAQRIGGPGTPGAADGLQRIAGRRSYEGFKTGAAADRRAGRPDDALGKYDEARKADPAQYAADHLESERSLAENESRAKRQPAPAPSLPPVSPEPRTEPPASTGTRPPTSAPAAPPPVVSTPAPAVRAPGLAAPPIYDALVAYLRGDTDRAAALLRPLAESDQRFDAAGRASIHGYLGVAYAASALQARSAADRDQWRQKADAEFRLAERAQPGFQLSGRVVSPVIQSMIDAARR